MHWKLKVRTYNNITIDHLPCKKEVTVKRYCLFRTKDHLENRHGITKNEYGPLRNIDRDEQNLKGVLILSSHTSIFTGRDVQK